MLSAILDVADISPLNLCRLSIAILSFFAYFRMPVNNPDKKAVLSTHTAVLLNLFTTQVRDEPFSEERFVYTGQWHQPCQL